MVTKVAGVGSGGIRNPAAAPCQMVARCVVGDGARLPAKVGVVLESHSRCRRRGARGPARITGAVGAVAAAAAVAAASAAAPHPHPLVRRCNLAALTVCSFGEVSSPTTTAIVALSARLPAASWGGVAAASAVVSHMLRGGRVVCAAIFEISCSARCPCAPLPLTTTSPSRRPPLWLSLRLVHEIEVRAWRSRDGRMNEGRPGDLKSWKCDGRGASSSRGWE